jgi:PAS domain S-box-containing protein
MKRTHSELDSSGCLPVLLASYPIPTIVYDTTGVFISMNKAMSVFSLEFIDMKTVLEELPGIPDGCYAGARFKELVKNLIAGRTESISFALFVTNASGKGSMLACIAFPIKIPETVLVVHGIELTNRAERVQPLQDREERFHYLYQSMPLAYQSLDENGCLVDVNQTWLQTMGYQRNEVIGRWFGEFLVPVEQDLFSISYPRYLSIGEIHGVEYDLVRKTGEIITVSVDGKTERVQNRGETETHCIFKNITEARRAREELALFRQAVDSTANLIAGVDREERFILANDAFCSLMGKRREDLIGEPVSSLHETGPFAQLLKQNHMRCLSGGSFTDEYSQVLPDRGLRHYMVSFSPFRNDLNEISGVVFVGRDMTDRKNAEEQLRRQTEYLEKLVEQRTAQVVQASKSASLGTFAAGVAHEKRQYMQTVLSNAERIEDNIDRYYRTGDYEGFRTFVRERIDVIKTTIKVSDELIQSLIDYSRGDQVRYVPISPREQIEHTLRIIGHALISDKIMLDTDIADTPKIMGNAMQIREIVMNLITNARYAVNAVVGAQVKHIVVTLTSDESNIRIIVTDNGIGMTPEQIGKVFDPFYTTKSPREGTGLGLSLVYTYVENHHGIIRVQSKPDKGTTFEVTIPLLRTISNGT